MNIVSEHLVIRAIEPTDLKFLHAWFNDPTLAGLLGDLHFPSSSLHQQQWLNRITENETNVRLAVATKDGLLIGYTGFWQINWFDRRAEHGVLLGNPEMRGKGYGKETIKACCDYAFYTLNLERLEAFILESNVTSINAYQACGFEVEGCLRNHAFRNGQRINRCILGRLRNKISRGNI